MECKDLLKAYEDIGTVEDFKMSSLFNEIGIYNILNRVEYGHLPTENKKVCLIFYKGNDFVTCLPSDYRNGEFGIMKHKNKVPEFDELYWTDLDFFEGGV